jgi:hypothetical protein
MVQPSASIRKKDITAFYVAEHHYVSITVLKNNVDHVMVDDVGKTE